MIPCEVCNNPSVRFYIGNYLSDIIFSRCENHKLNFSGPKRVPRFAFLELSEKNFLLTKARAVLES